MVVQIGSAKKLTQQTNKNNFNQNLKNMKQLFTNIKTTLFLTALLVVLFGAKVNAQVSAYTFGSSAGTYTEISGGTVLGTATNDDNVFNNNPIGFAFFYNGVPYCNFSVNANGFIALGGAVTSSYTSLSTGATNNVIAAFNRDIQGNAGTGELSYLTTGSAPNRTLVVQFKSYRNFNDATGQIYNFQIRLSEGTNQIRTVYGSGNYTGTNTHQVGLRGASNADFNNRTTTTDWSATTAGGTNAATCTSSSTVFPASGLTFTWTPAASPTTTYYSKSTATNFSTLSDWGVNGDGSGAAPGAIDNTANFIVANGANVTLNATLSVRSLYILCGSTLNVAANTLNVAITGLNQATFVNLGTLNVTGVL